MTNPFARSMVVAVSIVGLAVLLPIGAGGVLLEVALIVIAATLGWHALLVGALRFARTKRASIMLIVVVAYLLGSSFVGVGGLLWQLLYAGWARTNVSGYLVWCWVYGLALLPVMAPASWWVVQPVLERGDHPPLERTGREGNV
jgi:hypothetical protein